MRTVHVTTGGGWDGVLVDMLVRGNKTFAYIERYPGSRVVEEVDIVDFYYTDVAPPIYEGIDVVQFQVVYTNQNSIIWILTRDGRMFLKVVSSIKEPDATTPWLALILP